MTQSNLIDRYVVAVGSLLLPKQRADVQLELRTALQDALEERGLDPEDDNDVAALLKEFGAPHKVAAEYGARTYLIGPDLYMPYLWVTRIVLGAMAIANLVVFAIGVVSGGDVVGGLFGALGNLFNGIVMAFGFVTLLFALLDHYAPSLQLPKIEWDPKDLPEITPEHNKLDWADSIVEVVFTAFFVWMLVTAPGWSLPAPMDFVPALIQKFAPLIPWIIAISVAQVSLNVVLMSLGVWRPWLRWADAILSLANLAVVGFAWQMAPYSDRLLVNSVTKLAIGVAIIASAIDFGIKVYKVVQPDKPFPWRVKQAELEQAN